MGPADSHAVEMSVAAAIGDAPVQLDILRDDARPQLVYATQLSSPNRCGSTTSLIKTNFIGGQRHSRQQKVSPTVLWFLQKKANESA